MTWSPRPPVSGPSSAHPRRKCHALLTVMRGRSLRTRKRPLHTKRPSVVLADLPPGTITARKSVNPEISRRSCITDFRFLGLNGHRNRGPRLPLMTQPVSKRQLTVLVSLAPCADGLVDRFCRCFAVSAFCMAVFAGYRRPDAANGPNNGLPQAGMACARIAAISGLIPMMLITRLRL